MKITFITNYLTHHQLPFAEEMYRLLGEDFSFIATNVMEEERIAMGWGLSPKQYPFVVEHDADYALSHHLLMDSDVVICGGTHESYIRKRLDAGKLTFRYFERLYKKGQKYAFAPRGYLRKWKEHTKYRKKPVYLLCAGAYVASDFGLFFSYPGKMLKWGYFPAYKEYKPEQLMEKKKNGPDILWTGRMLHWKHGSDVIRAVVKLKKEGFDCHLTMIGEGEELPFIQKLIQEEGLSEQITLLPFQSPEVIREYMEKSRIYLMTSDFEEGWGAVVNEAMNSGCAVIASSGAGSVPYLIRHGENGLVYKSGDVEELTGYIKELLQNSEEADKLGNAAYETIRKEWNGAVAAKRFVEFCEKLSEGKYEPRENGPLSLAPKISSGQGYSFTRR